MKYLLLILLLVGEQSMAAVGWAHLEEKELIAYIKQATKHRSKAVPAEAIAAAIVTASDVHEVDPYLILAQIEQESGFDPNAIGLRGERGLMQIKQSTAKSLHLPWENAFDILLNVDAGTRYLSTHLKKYDNVEKALSRYNGGSNQYAMQVKARYLKIVWSKL